MPSQQRQPPFEGMKWSIKTARKISELQPLFVKKLADLRQRPVDTVAGIAVVGRDTPECEVSFLKEMVIRFLPVFGKNVESKIETKRSINLREGYHPPKVRFTGGKGNPMARETILAYISRGLLREYTGKVSCTNRWFIVRKPGVPADTAEGWRLVVDITINKGIVPDTFPMCSCDEISQAMAPFNLFWSSDIRDAYNTVKNSEEALQFLVILEKSFPTPLVFTGMPNGLKNSQAALNRAFHLEVFPRLFEKGLKSYVDNFQQGAFTWGPFANLLKTSSLFAKKRVST